MQIGIGLFLGAALGGGGAPAPPFDPATLFSGGKLGAFYRISDLTTLFSDRSATPSTPAVVDGVVGTIKDKSGNANHAIAAADVNRAILRTDGTHYWLEPNGLTHAYALTNVAVTTNFSTLYAANRAAAGASTWAFGDGIQNTYGGLWFTDNKIYNALGSSVGSTAADTATGPVVLTSVRNATNEILRKNGVQVLTRGSPAVANNFNSLFKVAATFFSSSKFYGGMFINTELTGSDLTSAEAYFTALAPF